MIPCSLPATAADRACVPPMPARPGAARPPMDRLLGDVHNGELPGPRAVQTVRAVAPAWNRDWKTALLLVASVALFGAVAYWTFGTPIFGPFSRSPSSPPRPSPSLDQWHRVNQVLGKSHG